MRYAKSPIFWGLLVLSVGLWAGTAQAFHDGGVAHCNGCHTMHAAGTDNPAYMADGVTLNPDGNPFLLKNGNSTDTCLNCHDHHNSYGNAWGGADVDDTLQPGDQRGAGQFVFLKEDNINDGHGGSTSPILGHQAGHNVISLKHGTDVDPVNATAPGGAAGAAYDSTFMHCTSCHDPHGKGGHYRILYGDEFPESYAMGFSFSFVNPAPTAVGIGFWGAPESGTNHVGYQSGMSLWCANCHGDFHNTDPSLPFAHVAGVPLTADVADAYNYYEGTGNHGVGDPATSYEPMIPVEDTNNATGWTGPVSVASKVMCLTCHRAHATSAPNAGRWDFDISTWEDEGVESGSYVIPNPYAATAGPDQRSLCNKCHLQDPVDPNP